MTDRTSLRIVSLKVETFDVTNFDGVPKMMMGRVRVVASNMQTTLEWWSTIEDAPRIGDIWIGGAP